MRFNFRRKPNHEPLDLSQPVDENIARQVAALVNAGDVDGADALCKTTSNPRGTAFLAFRWIDVEEPS
ncbi:hypothetical protein [Streptomyces sp. ME19-01-6]|uniref:hypothetical protein n=1 Tax=Streptomyces sp. ME19-01-6 TaxID=3028686 RepID=UPI0029AAEB46|nr:hypothetical protein [Streptomyces sp. ME19-01-6]MDX3230605.1 hypothetical protein [Streptomyces sp. ME19-01-6]